MGEQEEEEEEKKKRIRSRWRRRRRTRAGVTRGQKEETRGGIGGKSKSLEMAGEAERRGRRGAEDGKRKHSKRKWKRKGRPYRSCPLLVCS